MTHSQAIEILRNDLRNNKANYSQEQLLTGYDTLATLIDEYLTLIVPIRRSSLDALFFGFLMSAQPNMKRT